VIKEHLIGFDSTYDHIFENLKGRAAASMQMEGRERKIQSPKKVQ